MKFLKLMADYECFPTWEIFDDDLENIDPNKLKISDELKKELEKWSTDYDLTLNQSDPINSGFADENHQDNFDKIGQKLFVMLKQQLGDGYSVEYCDSRGKKSGLIK